MDVFFFHVILRVVFFSKKTLVSMIGQFFLGGARCSQEVSCEEWGDFYIYIYV